MEKINFQDLPSTSTPLNSTNLNQMQDNMENAIIPIKLVSISDTAPESATTGDMYYNTTDNKVYTATGENTWDSGSTPRYDGFYINTSNNTLFYYNGSTLIGVGGSGSGIGGDTLPVGMIMPGAFPSTLVVEDWLKCDGSAVSRTEYSELFNTIGVSYGSGDGSTTFNLPNIKGKMIIGYDPDDNDFDTMGATGGSKTHTQTVNEMPSHNHQLIGNTNTGNKVETVPYGSQLTGTSMYAVKATGGGQAMDIMNPYIVLNYYIKAHKTAPIYATVKNEETTSETDVYSCNYINNMQVNITTNGTPVKTGRIIDGKEEYIKRGKVILGESAQSDGNLRWLINPGLTSVELTKSISVAIISGSNVLDGNMVRTSGLSVGDSSQCAYFDGTNIIFETAGMDRQGQNFCYEIYFTYNS